MALSPEEISALNAELDKTPYRVTGALGRGGFGAVYEVEHVALGLPMALKLLHKRFEADEIARERFRLEARALTKVRHPNVLGVSDFGLTRSGAPYFAAERLYGQSCAEMLRARGRLPLPMAASFCLQALDALGAVHAAGIVHRDVKPSNLFACDADGEGRRLLKLLDFGIVKVQLPPVGEPLPSIAPDFVTETGGVLGTPTFMAPEQSRGSVDARADLYSLGAVLYALVTGRPPFVRSDAVALIMAHLVEPPEPPSRYAAEPLPRELDELVLQALAKSPDERFESARAMAYALRQIVPSASDYRDAPAAVQLRSSDEASRALWGEEGGEDPPATAADLDKPAHAVSASRQAAGLSANAAQEAALAPTVAAVAGSASAVSAVAAPASGAGAGAAPALLPQAGPPQVCEPGRRYGGRYVVEELLARGGIAEIYRVRHAVTGGKYAFKVLQARLRRRSDIVARLRGEALALAALKSPHVVQVIDCDEDPAVGLFVVMELIDGMSLREVMNALRSRGRSLTMLQALDYVLETADALSALHLVGIIHRDLKPENIHVLRTPDGERLLKLLDLGAAKNYQSVAVVTDGNIVATPKYASPEHLAGKPTGPWSDVYSLGHVAYELLAGRHAFDGLDAGPMGMGYIGMHLFHPIAPLAEIDPRVPQFVSAIVERATAKEPWLRWPSMAALADEIREAIGKLTGKRVVRATPREHEADLAEVLQMRSGVAGGGGAGDLGPSGLGRGAVGPAGTAVIDLAPGEPSLVDASSSASTTTTVVMRREAAEPLAPSPGLPAVAWRAPAPPPPVASPAVPVVASPARPLVASTPAPSPLAPEEPWGLTVLGSRDHTLRPGTHFCVLGSFVALGWHSKAKLRVLDDKLMPLHCGVLRRGDCCIIAHPERLPPAIEHAGELVREATLDPGGVVRVGETNLRFWLAPEPADGPRILVLGSEASPSQQERYAQSLPQARLVVLESLSVLRDDDGACNPDPGTEIEIACPRFTFGWADGADLTLIDPEIEHLHAVITAEQGRHRLVAFGPRPITVDGQPCRERWLEPGARIEVGRTVLAYAEGGASCVRATTSRLAASRGPNVSGRPAGGRRKGGAGP